MKYYIFSAYGFENLKKQIENNIDDYAEKIKAWQKVKRLYKKDGSDFANLKNSFDGCTINHGSYSSDSIEANVYYYTQRLGHRSDAVSLQIYKERALKNGYDINGRLVGNYCPYIIANAAEAENEIKLHIEYLKEQLTISKKALKNFDKMRATFEKEITSAFDKAEKQIGSSYAYDLKKIIN